jgi:hypothetical protein
MLLVSPTGTDTLERAVETSDITVQILRDIRDEIRGTNARLDTTNARLEKLETRVDSGFADVDACFASIDGHLSAITSLHRDMARLRPIGDGDALVKRVTRCERDIAELKQRIDDPRR